MGPGGKSEKTAKYEKKTLDLVEGTDRIDVSVCDCLFLRLWQRKRKCGSSGKGGVSCATESIAGVNACVGSDGGFVGLGRQIHPAALCWLQQASQMDEGYRTRVRRENFDAYRIEDIGIRQFGENVV